MDLAADRSRRRLARLAVGLWILLPGLVLTDENEPMEAAEVAELFASAVVVIQADVGGGNTQTGSGFFVSPDGVIATSLHNLEGARRVVVVAGGERHDSVAIRTFDVKRDLALIQVEGVPPSVVVRGEAASLKHGDRLFVIGNPLGLAGTISQGILSAWREPDSGRDEQSTVTANLAALPQVPLLQFSAAVSPGSSGAPVFDSYGRAVGIVAGGIGVGALDLNFAVPIEELDPFIELNQGLTLASLQERVDQQRQDEAEPHLTDARFHLERGDREEASRALDRALGIFPRSEEALVLKGELALGVGQLEQAEAAFRAAADANPNSAGAWERLGRLLVKHRPERIQEATACLEKSLEIDPWRAETAYGLGEAYLLQRRLADAKRMWEEAVEIDREFLPALLALGRLEMVVGDLDGAERAFKNALWADRDNAAAHRGLSEVYRAMGEIDRARRHWQRYLELAGEDP